MAKYREAINLRKEAKLLPGYIIVVTWVAFTAVMLGWIFAASLSTSKEIFTGKVMEFESGFHWENYKIAWETQNVSVFFANSLLYSLVSVAGVLLISAPAAYVLSRWNFTGSKAIRLGLLIGMSVPTIMVIMPLYTLAVQWQIKGRILLIALYIMLRVPYTTMYLLDFFGTLSKSYEEAAYIDGCPPAKAFWVIMLPLVQPAVITVTIFNFLSVWNEYEDAIGAGESVIAIIVSGSLSGTYQSAMIAAQEFPGKVFVVDSMNAAVGQQILVRYAAQLTETMDDPERIVSILNEAKRKIHTMAVVDTLDYLKKGGRISGSTAFVGEMLSIKPVLAIEDGVIKILGKARGSKNGNNFLIKEIGKTGGIDFEKPLCLGYTGLSDACLQKYILDSQSLYAGHEDSLRICTVGAAIGTHIGPGAVAVAFFEK